MDGGIEGINIQSAKNSILEYKEISENVMQSLCDVASNFLYGLKAVWASPNAVDFTTKFQKATSSIRQQFVINVNRTLIGLYEAGLAICSAHGASHQWANAGVNNLNIGSEAYSVFGQICNEEKNGITGMVTENVRLLVEELQSNINNLSSVLNQLPESIEFYSTDGSLISSYKTGKQNFVDTFSRLFEQTISKINEYMVSEVNNILVASSTAFDAINNTQIPENSILNTENFF